MKLPISLEDIQSLCKEYDAMIIAQGDKLVRIQKNRSIIDIWLSTGTFRNIRTNYRGLGKKDLVDYLNFLQNPSKNDSKPVQDSNLDERITKLENRCKALTDRLIQLEEIVSNLT